jgi:3-hydroxyisobutyrate dehydrogenase-like beta-hydroxyacid dehydrogenase
MTRIGVLHPGAMGSSVVAALVEAGHPVYWLAADRSEATRLRACGRCDRGADSRVRLGVYRFPCC